MKNIYSGLKFVFFSRGLLRGLTRLRFVRKRFGFMPKKQIKYINYYVSLLKHHAVKATFFIPAKLLERYIEDIKKIESENIEWGIHGYIHTDLSRLKLKEQKEQIVRAVNIFDKYGVIFRGFRAPYLRTNAYTMEALAEVERFSYVSTNTILWDEIYGTDRGYFKWITDFYNPSLHSHTASYPKVANGMVEIAVSLPDDDILVDRERMSSEFLLYLWKNMLRLCHEKNEVFVLQLHPERIYELGEVLIELINDARMLNPPVWIATLGEMAKWLKSNAPDMHKWPASYQGVFCITGDIDSVTISDFTIRLKEW